MLLNSDTQSVEAPLHTRLGAHAQPLRDVASSRPSSIAQRLFQGRGWLLLRLGTDAALLLCALVAAHIGAEAAGVSKDGQTLLALFPPLVLVLMALRGMYQRKIQARVLAGLGKIVGATSLAAMILIAVAAFVDPASEPAPLLARAWFFATAYVTAGRLVLDVTQRRARIEREVGKRTLIVGAGQVGTQVERRLRQQPELGLQPIGFLDADPAPAELVPERSAPVLGSPADLARVAEKHGAEHVILAFVSAPDSVLLPLVRECEERGLETSLVPRLFESVNVHVALEHLGGLPLFGLRSVDPKGWQFAVKHAFDRMGAGVFLVLLAPLLLAAAAAVKLSSPGPLFFRQLRIGRDGHEFEIFKFRTMHGSPEDDGEANAGWAAAAVGYGPQSAVNAGPDRRTRVGKLLRRYSIDELPQFINVLKGDMSLVGPRPELPHWVRLFEGQVHRYNDRHRVKSGLTGWAQVHGMRGNTSLPDRVELDNWYVQNWSLALDVQIMLLTAAAVFKPPE
jgi:exopolysaccharide biosynthesis polyprenyl glycosylphosphotransferase